MRPRGRRPCPLSLLFRAMPTSFRFSSRWPIFAALALLAILAAVFYFSFRDPAVPASQTAEASSAPASSPASNLSAAEWEARVEAADADSFQSLMDEALRISDADLRQKIVTAITARWLNADRKSYLAFLDTMEVDEEPGSPTWEVVLTALADGLTQLDDEAASDPLLNKIVQRVVDHLALRDPERACSWATNWLLGEAKDQALATVVPALGSVSPDRALEVLAQIETPVPRMDAVSELGTTYATQDPAAALAWAKQLTAPLERVFATRSVLAEIAHEDPATASVELAAYGARLQEDYQRQVEADRVKLGIKGEDEFNSPEEYAAYVEENGIELPPPVSPEVELLAETAATVAWELAAQNPRSAVAWAESLPEGVVKSRARIGTMRRWVVQNPDEAIAHYLSNYRDDAGLAEFIYESWAAENPVAASKAINRMPDVPHRERATVGVVSGWLDADNDPTALVKWVDALDSGRAQDQARATIAEAVGYDYPELAWKNATRIQDPLARRRSLLATFPNLVQADPAEARRALAALKLPQKDAALFEHMLEAR